MAFGSEVGTGHVSIFPVMNGFRSRINKEMQASGKSGASTFGTAFSKAAGSIGSRFGKALKKGVDAAGPLADDMLKQYRRDLAKATSANSAALLKQRDAQVAVREAQEKLNQATEKYGEGSTQAERAAIRLEQAQLRESDAAESVKTTSERLEAAKEALRAAEDTLASSSNTLTKRFRTQASAFAAGLSSIERGKSSFTGLAGAFGSLVRAVSGVDMFAPLTGKISAFVKNGMTTIGGFAAQIGSTMANGLKGAVNAVQTHASSIGKSLKTAASDASRKFGELASKLPAPIRSAGKTIGTTLAGIGRYFGNVGSAAGTVFSKLPSSASVAFSRLSSLAGKAANGMSKAFSTAANASIEAIRGISTAGMTVAAAGIGALTAKIASMVPEAIAASDATDKFKTTLNFAGLDTSTIERLTASTQKYADQTVYDLSDIQNVTAQLAANAVPNYDRLAEAAGNLNAVAGGNKDTFRSVAMVLTQTAGQGKLTTENFNQLSDAIPGASGKIQQALKDMGAYTSGDFRTAMSEGEISAEEFNEAIMQLGMTDVAAEAAKSTSTFEGAWGNFEAAITGGLKKIIDAFKPLATGVISQAADMLTGFFDTAGGLAEQVAGMFSIDGLTSLLDGFEEFLGISGTLESAIGTITPLLSGLGGAFVALGSGGLGSLLSNIPLVGGALGGLTGPLGMLGGPVGVLLSTFAGLAATSPQLQSVLGQLGQTFVDMLGTAIQPLVPAFGSVVNAANTIMSTLSTVAASILSAFVPVIQQISPLVQTVFEAAGAIIQDFADGFAQIVDSVGGLITGTLIPAFQNTLQPTIDTVIRTVTDIINTLRPTVSNVIDAVVGFVTGTLIPAFQNTLQPTISKVMNAVNAVVNTLAPIVSGVVSAVAGFINGTLLPTFKAMEPFISGVISNVGSIIQGIADVVSGVVGVISGIISGNWGGVWNSFKSIASGAVGALGGILGGIKNAVMGALSGAGTWLVNSGKSIIDGLVNGIKTAISGAVSAVSGALSSIRDLFPFSPAKKGPFSGHGWVLYSGRSIGQALAQGIDDKATTAETAARDVMRRVKSALDVDTSAGIDVARGTRAGRVGRVDATRTGAGREITVNQTIVNPDPRTTAAIAAETLRRSL